MIILFNPRSTSPGKQPLPLSVLSLAAALPPDVPWRLVDGNRVDDPAEAILALLPEVPALSPVLLAVTVMPGPQLTQAIVVCRTIRARAPHVVIVWGGYFPSQHTAQVVASPLVDIVVRSQGERALAAVWRCVRDGGALGDVPGVSWHAHDGQHDTPTAPLIPLDDLPDVPYDRVDMPAYLQSNYLGRRTVAYHSSFGCPFACHFCAVTSMVQRRWVAQSAARMADTIQGLMARYGVDAVQMNDMDFFISEARAREFADRMMGRGLRWWALGRVDVLSAYSDATWEALARSGLAMVFSGAESGSDAELARMGKGGQASTARTLELVARLRRVGVVPELSFVLGAPPDPLATLDETLQFVRRVKRANPATEIILYTYTPVAGDDTPFPGFTFPTTLEEWASPSWQEHALRRGERLPWVTDQVRRRARNFERVLNAYYPTVTDVRLKGPARWALRGLSAWRYWLQWYAMPLELRAVQRVLHYQRPETTGF